MVMGDFRILGEIPQAAEIIQEVRPEVEFV